MNINANMCPIKCGVCKNSVVKSGLKCSCANKVKKCCEEEIIFSTTDDPSQESENGDSVHEISEYSNQDLLLKIIRELEDKNRLLQENTALLKYKISILENQINKKEPVICNVCEKPTNIRNEKINNRDKRGKQYRDAADMCVDISRAVTNDPGQSTSKDEPKSRPQITGNPQSNVRVLTEQKTDGENISNTNQWRTVVSKKNKRKSRPVLVIGKSLEPSTVEGVEKLRAFHVSRLKPSTTTEDLQTFLNKNFRDVKCEQLQSKYPESYSSFKVLIRNDEFEKVQDSSNWPNNACVNYYFHRQRRNQEIV